MVAGCGGDDEDGGEGSAQRFDSQRAFESILMQVDEGPRPAGSPASRELAEHLKGLCPTERSSGSRAGLQRRRHTARSRPGDRGRRALRHRGGPPGASSAPTTARRAPRRWSSWRAPLERELPDEHREVRFVLFDGEEEPPGCPDARFEECALRGSKAYVEAHPGEVGELILLDYVANEGLQLPREANSDPALWGGCASRPPRGGRRAVLPEGGDGQYAVVDDHIPFVRAGVPSIDLIDFDYEYADTVEDTPDKLDPEALDAVGEAVAELVDPAAAERASVVVVVEPGAGLAAELARGRQLGEPPGGRWCFSPQSAWSASPIAIATSIPIRSSRARGPIG